MQLITYKIWTVHRLSKKEGRGKAPRKGVRGGGERRGRKKENQVFLERAFGH